MKTTKPTIIPSNLRVDVPRLRFALCGNKHKLPEDFSPTEWYISLYTPRGEYLGGFRLKILTSKEKKSLSRIYVRWGNRLVPIGRLNQALA